MQQALSRGVLWQRTNAAEQTISLVLEEGPRAHHVLSVGRETSTASAALGFPGGDDDQKAGALRFMVDTGNDFADGKVSRDDLDTRRNERLRALGLEVPGRRAMKRPSSATELNEPTAKDIKLDPAPAEEEGEEEEAPESEEGEHLSPSSGGGGDQRDGLSAPLSSAPSAATSVTPPPPLAAPRSAPALRWTAPPPPEDDDFMNVDARFLLGDALSW